MQGELPVSQRQLVGLCHLREAILRGSFGPCHARSSSAALQEGGLAIGLALVNANVLHTFACVLAAMRAGRGSSDTNSEPADCREQEQKFAVEALGFLQALFFCVGNSYAEQPTAAITQQRLRLLGVVVQALGESSLLEHCSALLSRGPPQDVCQQAAAAASGCSTAGISQLPSVLQPVPDLSWILHSLYQVLDCLDENLASLPKLARALSWRPDASMHDTTARVCKVLEARIMMLQGQPCLAYLVMARACSAVADAFGVGNFGLPHGRLADMEISDPLLQLLKSLSPAGAVWQACLTMKSASDLMGEEAQLQWPYGATEVFLLCERVAQQLCAPVAAGTSNIGIRCAALALGGMQVALEGMPQELSERLLPRAVRCLTQLMSSWRLVDGAGEEAGCDGDISFVQASRRLLCPPGNEWGGLDEFDEDGEKALVLLQLSGPPSHQLAAALAEGLPPALEHVWRAVAVTDNIHQSFWFVRRLGGHWVGMLAHAPAAQMACLIATLRKWWARALEPVCSSFPAPGGGCPQAKEEEEDPDPVQLDMNLKCLNTLLEGTRLLLEEAAERAAGAGSGAGEGLLGPPAPLPAQVSLLLVHCMAQWLPVVSRCCLECFVQGDYERPQYAADADMTSNALRAIAVLAEQCRVARSAAALASLPPAAAAAAAAGLTSAAATSAVPAAGSGAAAAAAPDAKATPPAQAFASWRTLLLRDVRAFDICAAVLKQYSSGKSPPESRLEALLCALDTLIAALPEDARRHLLRGRRQAASRANGDPAAAALALLACGRGPVWLHCTPGVAILLAGPHAKDFAHLGPLLHQLPKVADNEAAALVACVRPQPRAPAGDLAARQLLPPPCAAAALLPVCSNSLCSNLAGPSEAALLPKDCARCGRARYCCRPCQLAHWPEHKDTCAGRLVWG